MDRFKGEKCSMVDDPNLTFLLEIIEAVAQEGGETFERCCQHSVQKQVSLMVWGSISAGLLLTKWVP